MVFSSLTFLYGFLPLCLACYFVTKNLAIRNAVLILFSLAFYAWGEPIWILLLLFSTFMDWGNALIAEKYRGKWQAKLAIIVSCTINLGALALFKYSGFLVEQINGLLGSNWKVPAFRLPLGISFYTFQTLSYVFDVYRGDLKAQRDPLKVLLFVSLFHQLVAGPIVRYIDIERQIEYRPVVPPRFAYGINRFIKGLAKKVILANMAGEIAGPFLKGNLESLSILGAWFGIALYGFQIYFDFSAYSDMAIGLGEMFGFTYKENFDYPYISRSATEFWRRWHISLGTFFRDYLYIPLGGNRRMVYRNLLIVWLLTGLWHGASWNFVLWGLWYGFLIALEKAFLGRALKAIPGLLGRIVSHSYLILAVLFGWVLFYYTDLRDVGIFLRAMVGAGGRTFTDAAASLALAHNAFFLAACVLGSLPLGRMAERLLPRAFAPSEAEPAGWGAFAAPVLNFVLLAASTSLLVGESYNPFLYFRF
jgi:alginate O-acetyltransferase complex protein AlgI